MRGFRVMGLLTVIVLLLSMAPAAFAQTSTPPPDQAPGVTGTAAGTPAVGAPGMDQAPGVVVPSAGQGQTGTGTDTGSAAGQENTAQGGDSLTLRASEILGMRVLNMEDRRLGRIDNLLVAPSSGDVVYALVSSGGFLASARNSSPCPSASSATTRPRRNSASTSPRLLSSARQA
jgi:hypothetical protein